MKRLLSETRWRHLELELLENRIFLDANPLAAVDGSATAEAQDVHLESADPNDPLTDAGPHDTDSMVLPPEPTENPSGSHAEGSQDVATDGETAVAATAGDNANSATETTGQSPPLSGEPHDSSTPGVDADMDLDPGEGSASPDSEAPSVETSSQDNGTPHDAPLQASADTVDPEASSDTMPVTDGDLGDPVDGSSGHDFPGNEGEESASGTEAAGLDAEAVEEAPVAVGALSATGEGDPADMQAATADGLEGETDRVDDGLGADHGLENEAVDPMIGEDFTFSVSFDNTTGSTVYGPYIDLLLDGGQDGSDAAVDGITFQSATYLGANVESSVFDITADGQTVTHPWAKDSSGDPLELTGINGQTFRAGDQFVSLRMPFGSFTPDQPAADVVITAHMSENADVGGDLDIETTTGAMFGNDELDNPTSDHPLRDMATTSTSFKPEVISYNADIEASNIAADCQQQHDPAYDDTRQWADDVGRTFEVNHQEVTTGPNYPAAYVVRLDIADGQTVSGITLTEHLPANIFFLGDSGVSVTAGGVVLNPGTDYTISSPGAGVHSGQELVVALNNPVAGASGNDDVVIRYDFYVPHQNASGGAVIDPDTGDDIHIINNGEVGYSWTPVDVNDASVADTILAEVNADGHFSSNPDVDDISHAQSIAIQKSHTLNDIGASGYSPDDTLDYRLDFQVSDYFSFGDRDITDGNYSFRIDDVVADGLTMHTDAGGHYTAVIDVWENGNHYHRILTDSGTPGDAMWTSSTAGVDDLEVHYNLQQIFQDMGISNGILRGDLVDGSQQGPTHARISYSADIAQVYHSETGGGSDNHVDQGDVIESGVSITGDVYDGATGVFGGQAEDDHSCDSIQIITGSVDKDIFAINGSTTVGTNPHISPGDRITYQLHYNMPISSTEDFHLNDYLPLPIFDVTDPDQDGTPSGWSEAAIGTIPGAGEWAYTASDTYHNLTTIDSVSAQSGNLLVFDWAPYHDPGDTHAVVDILFTVTASNKPFADGMFLTNQVRATEQGSPLDDNHTDAIVQIVLDEPELQITKGVVATDNPEGQFSAAVGPVGFTSPGSGGFRGLGDITESGLDARPVDADLNQADAGDLVTFAIVARNVGHSGAFDVKIDDDLPAGFDIPTGGLNLSVTDGHGAAISYTDASGDAPGTAGFDFFSGILLADDADGALDANVDADSSQTDNVVVITYDLQVQDGVQPLQQLTNTALVADVAGTEGGPDHYPTDSDGPHDRAAVVIAEPAVTKTIIGTGEISTDGSNVVIGETVQYRVTMVIPEGESHSAHLADTLDDGLAMVSLDTIDHGHLQTDYTGGWSQVLSDARSGLSSPGDSFNIDFGNLTNPDRDDGTGDEMVTLTYTVVVLNTSGNQQGVGLNNAARFQWDDPNDGGQLHSDAQAPEVTVQEPDLQVDKQVWDPAVSSWVAADAAAQAVHYDQGDSISYRITVEHSAVSGEDAFDVVFTDTLPAAIDWSSAVASVDSGDTPDSFAFDSATGALTATWDELDITQATTFLVTGGLLNTATAGQTITNTGTVTWQSLADEHHVAGSEISPYNSASGERTGDTGDIGGAANSYTASDPGVIAVSGSVDKQDPSPASYTIGDRVTYDIVVTLPEGDTHSLLIDDDLPDGMAYLGYRVDASGFSGPTDVSHPATTVYPDGDVTFAFGDVSVTANNHPDDNRFVLRVTAVVENVSGNHQGTILANHADMRFQDPDHPGTWLTISDPTDPTISVIEPQITTTKGVVDSSDAGADASPGEVLTYTVRFTNTGQSTAYEVSAVDDLPDGVVFNAGSATGRDQDGNAVGVAVTDDGAGNLTLGGDWDIAVNDWVEVRYTVTVMSAGFTSGNYTNTVNADWSSQDGDATGERLYDDGVTGPGSPVDGDQDVSTAAFTVVTEGSIGDMVFFDAGGDGGAFDAAAGDVGISGVDVSITADVDGDGTAEYSRTVRTDADGRYLFDHLPAFGDYTIRVDSATSGGTNPTDLTALGFVPTYDLDGTATPHSASAVSLAAGEHRTDADFGYSGQNTVGDTVWYDADADGIQDASEGGIGNLTVTLTADIDGDGIAEYTAMTTTDGSGHYQFDHLPAGDYTVSVTPPAGSQATYDQDSGTTAPDSSAAFVLSARQDRGDIDFGMRGSAAIGDFVWFDGDADGLQNDGLNSGLAGVTVTLSGDVDGDGLPDYATTTVTSADGFYHFDHLLGGRYSVTLDDTTLPAGAANWNPTFDADGISTAGTADVTLAAGTTDNGVDFGYTGIGAIGDFIFFDENQNGVQDPGEVGIANVQVTITGDVDGDGIAEFTTMVTTDSDGNYRVDHLPAGVYTVSVAAASLRTGFSQTADPDSVLDNQSTLHLGIAEDNTTMDFGYASVGSIGDFVFFDADADGNQDSGEVGIGGVTVTLVGDIDNDGIDETLTTVTDASGRYLFDHLPAGQYTVTVSAGTLPGGMLATADPDGVRDNTAAVTLTAGQRNLDQDFGYTGTGSIGDTLWNDINRNGVQEIGEPGIAGVTVTLTADFDGNGTADYTAATVTDGSGRYVFANLPAGHYTLALDPDTLPPGFQQTYDPDGIFNGATRLTLDAGQNDMNQDFGYARAPLPPQPPVVPPVVPPVEPPTSPPEPAMPPTVGPEFAFDVLHMRKEPSGIETPADRFFAEKAEELWYLPARGQVFEKPLIPVAPIYTGSAEPGTTLRLDLYDTLGNRIGSQTVMADTGGNWLANFPGTLVYDEPHHVAIQQASSSYNTVDGSGYNMRTYFSPAPESKPFFFSDISGGSVFANTASTVLDAMHGFNHHPLMPDWDRFYGYEFFAPSANPSQVGR